MIEQVVGEVQQPEDLHASERDRREGDDEPGDDRVRPSSVRARRPGGDDHGEHGTMHGEMPVIRPARRLTPIRTIIWPNNRLGTIIESQPDGS